MVRQYVPERCGVSLSRSSCLNYLHRLGFAFKRPKKHLLKAQAEKREAFVVSRDARVERSWVVRGVAFMVQENFEVRLSPAEKEQLRKLMRAGRSSARAITRARILVKTDEGWNASQVAAVLDVSERTVFRAKRRYVEEGLEEVLRHHNSPNPYRRWMTGWKPTRSPWPAARLPRATTTGRCARWRARRWNWDWWSPSPMGRCGCG